MWSAALTQWLSGWVLGKDPRTPRPRSLQWPKVRAAHLLRHPACEVCRTRKKLEVHHTKPFHLWPEFELDPANLMTLCDPHHLLFGHLMDWRSWNPRVWDDAEEWRRKLAARPKHAA